MIGPTFVSAATAERVAAWFGVDAEEIQRRFRYNVVFDGVEAFAEDRLYGGHFQVGDVVVDAINPCQRCVVPSRDSRTGAQDTGFQKRFMELREAELPADARRAQFTHFYRLTANTRIAASEAGKQIHLGDVVLLNFPPAGL